MEDKPLLDAPKIIAIGRELISRLTFERRSLEVRAERVANMAHGPMVYALASHCLRLGAVVLDLHEDDKELESMPLVRALYECALTAQWLSQSREAPAAVFNEETRKRRLLSKDFARSASQVFREGASKITGVDAQDLDTTANEQARRFDSLCDALQPGGRHAYAIYRAMSAYAHPSATLMDAYMVERDDTPTGVVLRETPEPIGHNTWLYLSVASMVWAARALDMMHRDAPHRDYLRRVARQLGTSDALHLTEDARANERRAEQTRHRAGWKGPNREKRRDRRR